MLSLHLQAGFHSGKQPAIIWITGGFSNGIGDIAWTPGPKTNDQSASAFWQAGVITMYPSFRGGGGNPGYQENFFGEVDDVLAAADYLATVPEVDPDRIYLGGHSTGGTLALLVAETGRRFRAVFSFGPVDDILGYGDDVLVFDTTNSTEAKLRAPVHWMNGIVAQTFVFEGAGGRGNLSSLNQLTRTPHPQHVQFFPVGGADHFSTIRPVSTLIAQKILADTGTVSAIKFSPEEIKAAMAR